MRVALAQAASLANLGGLERLEQAWLRGNTLRPDEGRRERAAEKQMGEERDGPLYEVKDRCTGGRSGR